MVEADTKRVSKGYLQRNQAFATVIEAPGFYEGDTEEYSRRVVETELRNIGFLTHIVVAWHALELRETDLEVVLSQIKKYFGPTILDKLIFAVTFCDSSSKAKKYRSKRGISFNSISAMICEKVGQSFSTEEEPLIYFLCAKQPRDPSRKELVRFLNSGLQWSTFPVSRMQPWTSLGLAASQQEEEKVPAPPAEDDYEAVDEDVFEAEDQSGPPVSSVSLSNLHQASQPGLGRGRGGVSASTTALPQQGRRGGRKLLSSTSSTPALQHQHKTAGRGKSQPSLFGGPRSRSRSRSNLAKTTSNLALEQSESRRSGRPRGRGGSRSGSRSRAGPAQDQTGARDDLDDSRRTPRGRGGGGGGGQSSMFRSRSKSRSRGGLAGLAKTRSNLALQDSQPNLSQPNLYEDSPVREGEGGGGPDSETLERRPRGRMFSSGSTGGSTARRRGRSKSRERLRQSRQNLRQSESLPRPRTGPDEPERAPMRRSRSQWSVGSANRRRQQQQQERKPGDCVVL